jgi:hypothetical protein
LSNPCHERLRAGRPTAPKTGSWLRCKATTTGAVERTVYVDSTGVRAHQPTAEAREGGAAVAGSAPGGVPQGRCPGEALSRSVGGWTTTLRLAADRAYCHRSTCAGLRRRGLRHTPPERADRNAWRARQGARGGQSPAFERKVYRRIPPALHTAFHLSVHER